MAETISNVMQGEGNETTARLFPLRQELSIQATSNNPDGSPAWTLYDPVRQDFFRIGWLEFTLLSHWQPGRTIQDAVDTINNTTSITIDEEELLDFQKFLFEHNLLHITDNKYTQHLLRQSKKGVQGYFKQLLHHYLFFRIPLVKPDRFLDKTVAYAEKLVGPRLVVGLLFSFVLGLFLLSRQWESFKDSFVNFISLEGAIAYGVAIVFVKIAHELGHAYTAKHYGLKVPTMGIAFMVMWPVLYTDTTDSWRLASRKQRLNIVAAGMLVELSLAIMATLLWSFLPDGIARSIAFMVASVSWVMTLAVNLNPFMRFDGYYLLSDLLDTPNLQDRSFLLAKWWLRNQLFGIGERPDEWYTVRNPGLLIAYAFGTWIYRAILFIGIAVLVYYVFFKPLGLFLMAVEIGVFIVQPVVRELSAWYALRNNMHWNKATKRTSILFLGILVLLLVPWQQENDSIAIVRPIEHLQMYSPESAQIVRLHVSQGEQVKQGDLLIELTSPELNAAYTRTLLQVQTLSLQLSRVRTVESMLELSELTSERLNEARTELAALEERKQSLRILAPFSGKVMAIDDTLRQDRWINNTIPLLQLVNDQQFEIETYVPENIIARLTNTPARFYSVTDVLSPFTATITNIDTASTRDIRSPWFIQTYGGDVAATKDKQGKMRADTAVYRVLLTPTGKINLPHIERGTLQIPIESQSVLGRFWNYAFAVILRESGF